MNSMTLDRVFNTRRFLFLLRWELYAGYRALVVILGATLGIAFIAYFFAVPAGAEGDIVGPTFSWLVLLIGGVVFSSRAFRDVHRPGDALRYLTLPCSHFEKTLAKFAITAVGYALPSAAAYVVMTALAAPLTLLVFGRNLGLFNPFTADVLQAAGVYLALQSAFVFGSLFFRRMALAKTLLSAAGLLFAFALIGGIVFAAVNLDLIARGAFEWYSFSGRSFAPGTWHAPWMDAPRIVGWIVIGPFFWVVTFFRLKEQEVRSA
ncbi:MAG: hypothetical protein JXD23_03450 [Spirochaetales bacterium]|nr:hypothetical protein [Spirochaetales bacterium]